MSPFKSPHSCNKPGCPRLTKNRFCDEHTKQEDERYEKERGSASERGYDHNWHKVSEMHLREFPLCQECEKQGKTIAAILTHHIKRIVNGGDKLAWDNLESLCVECHDIIHKGDRWRR